MKKKGVKILILKVCRLMTSVVSLYLAARYFGVSIERDVWLLAMSAFLILDMAIWGPINETFRAKFVFLKEEFGESYALRSAQSLLAFTVAVTFFITTLIIWKPQFISTIIAPAYNQDQLTMLWFMIRILAPSLLFNQITQLLISILNSYESVYTPEIAGFISGLFTLFFIIVLAPEIGIFSLAYAYYIGLLLLLALLIIEIRAKKIRIYIQFKHFQFSAIKPFVLYALPFFLPYFIGQAALLIEKSIVSSLGIGAVSTLDYAKKFSDVAVTVLLGMLMTISVPVLSVHFMKNNAKAFVAELKQFYQFWFLLMTGIVTVFTVCPHAVVSLFYENSNVSISILQDIGNLAMVYSWAALAVFFYYVFGISLLSSKNGKQYAIYGSLAQILMILLNLLFSPWLQIYVFPVSLLLSHIVAAILMFLKMPYGKSEFIKTTLIYGGVLLLTVVILFLFNRYVMVSSPISQVLAINMSLLLAVLFALLFLFRLDERLLVAGIYRKFFGQK